MWEVLLETHLSPDVKCMSLDWFSTKLTLTQKLCVKYETMRLLKQVNKTTSLIPYERLYIQTLHQAGKLIPEQYPGDPNPLLQAVIVPHLTQT
jgi:hypothetical protein